MTETTTINAVARDALCRIDMLLVSLNCDSVQKRVVDTCRMIVKQALSLPSRNCDVGTAEERMHRYQALCREIDERHERFGEHAPAFAFPTPFAWEDRPYESEVKK